MSVAATIPISGFAVSPFDRAVSGDARALRKLILDVSDFSHSVALGEPKRAVHRALDVAFVRSFTQASAERGSRAVEPSTYVYSDMFLRLLPSDVTLPDIIVDTDGEILFEWDLGPRQLFSVSVGRDATLTFAGLWGLTKVHGTEHLQEALPLVISDWLARFSTVAAS